MNYGHIHRFFLRTIASQGVLTMAEAKNHIEKFTDNRHIQIQDLIKDINDEIRPYKQEIKLTSNGITGEEVIVFMSLGCDDATKSQNAFNANELEYFRIIMEQIFCTEPGYITEDDATKKFDNVRVTKAEALKLLNTWCNMYYLEKDGRNYALGIRTEHEFESYFRQNMPAISDDAACSLCKKIVFRGYKCPNCPLTIHPKCLNSYLKNVKKWPCCKFDFEDIHLDRVNQESYRSDQPHNVTETVESAAYDAIDLAINEESTDDMEMMDVDTPGPSHRVTRKRKHMDD